MDILNFFDPLTQHQYFDTVAGILALANPVALAPALSAIYKSDRAEGQSIMMWVIFLVIQIVFALVGAKAGNLGAFAAMGISVFMSLAAIVMITSKQRKPAE